MGGHHFGFQFAAGINDFLAQFDALGIALFVLKAVTAQVTADGGNFHVQILDVFEQIRPLGAGHIDQRIVGSMAGVDLNTLDAHLGGRLQSGMEFFAERFNNNTDFHFSFPYFKI
jgi:hypothetical protein